MLDFNKKLVKKIKNLPKEPGVYIFLDKSGSILYVGKAVKLRNRVLSYLNTSYLKQYPKTLKMMSLAYDLDYYLTDTEVEALILEANLIKKYKPPYNIDLKDDKAFKYVFIQKDKTGTYRVATSRKKNKQGSYFGPFPSGESIRIVLRDLRKLLPFRDCTVTKFNRYKKLKSPCLYGHIGLCPAPCQSNEGVKENNENIERLKKFLKGGNKKILKDLEKEMLTYAKNYKYEKAANVRDRLHHYTYLQTKYKDSVELLENVNSTQDSFIALAEMVNLLSFYFPSFVKLKDSLKNKNFEYKSKILEKLRIDFFDISNLSSSVITGAHITLKGGNYSKPDYRLYNIRTVEIQNDYEAMRELVLRRLNNSKKWGSMDIAVIDGGKGHLNAVYPFFKAKNIPVISLAKREEIIYIKSFIGEKPVIQQINLSTRNPFLSLLIKGRNEVHRFGLAHNKRKRHTLYK